MQSADFAKTKPTFETVYFIAKRRNAGFKLPVNFKAGRKAWCWHWDSISERQSGTNFINYIGEELDKRLEGKISGVNFFSVLTDGSEDASVSEKEAIFVQYLEKTPLEKIKLKFLQHFSGWYTCILKTLLFTKVKLSIILVFLFGISMAAMALRLLVLIEVSSSNFRWLKLLKFICISGYYEQPSTNRFLPGLLFWRTSWKVALLTSW